MAHRIKIFSRPHTNVDGSESQNKRDWFFRDKGRNETYESPAYPTKKLTIVAVQEYRDSLVARHKSTHPNDKRGMKATSDDGR